MRTHTRGQVNAVHPDFVGGSRALSAMLEKHQAEASHRSQHEAILAQKKAEANGDGAGDHARALATFLTGTQANIPTWADRLYLGWLLRIFQSPRTFLPRYWKAAWQFPRLLWSCRRELFGQGVRG
jgi:hypothetical protein